MKTARAFALSGLSLLATLFLFACGDDGGSGPSNSEPALSSDAGSSGDGSSVGGSSDDDGYSSDDDEGSSDSDGGRSSKKKSSSSTSSSSSDEGPQSPLGACAASNAGEVKQDADALVGEPGVRYVCDAGLGDWREATVLEYDTYLWDSAADGEVQKGAVTDAIYKYDSLQGAWRKANANDTAFGLGGCTQKREGKVDRGARNFYYICRNGKWEGAKVREYNTYGLPCDGNSALVSGLVVDSLLYVCDADTFRDATLSEKLANLGCTSYNQGDSVLYEGYARCAESGKWIAARTTIPGTLIDARDGNKSYNTIGIGLQRWMAENLDYADSVTKPSLVGRSWCYNDSAQYCAQYGRLYTYAAAVDSATTGCGYGKICQASDNRIQGVCPDGWHMPQYWELEYLVEAVGGAKKAGKFLKSSTGWNPGLDGEDAYGFSALPSGFRRHENGNFVNVGIAAHFWSSTGYSANSANYLFLSYLDDASTLGSGDEREAFPVRCVKD